MPILSDNMTSLDVLLSVILDTNSILCYNLTEIETYQIGLLLEAARREAGQ